MLRKKLINATKHPKTLQFLERHNIPLEYFRANRKMIARGISLGLFIALIPMPLQIVTVILLAPLFRFNVPIAIAMCLLTNPFTMPPTYYIEYLTGSFLLGIEPQSVKLTVEWFTQNLSKIFLPLYIGALFYSVLFSFTSYHLVNCLWRISIKKSRASSAE